MSNLRGITIKSTDLKYVWVVAMVARMRTSFGHRSAQDQASGFVFCVLLSLVVSTPWFFGGVWARVQWVLAGAVAVLLAVDVILQLRKKTTKSWMPTLCWPLLLGIGLGLFQLIPLSGQAAAWLAPHATEMRGQLISSTTSGHNDDTGSAPGGDQAGWGPRSIYAASTRTNLALLILATATCLLAARHGSHSRALLWMCVAITVCGIALAFFGLVQKMTCNGQIYWRIPLTKGTSPFGPFVNRNNAGGFLNLCLAGGLGTLVWMTWRGSAWDEFQNLGRDGLARSKPRGIFVSAFLHWVAQLNGRQLLLLGGIVCIAGGVFSSASRGSILAMFGGAGATAACVLLRRGNRGFAAILVALLVAGSLLMAWLGFRDEVESRFCELWETESREAIMKGGRLVNWQDALKAVPDSFWSGSGLDTYRFAYVPFQQRFTGNRWFYHAENQYIQALSDAGILGLMLLLAAILLTALAVLILFRKPGRAETVAATVGTYTLGSQIIGGSFDFGLYTAANTLLMATLCGAVVGRAGRLLVDRPNRWIAWPVDRVTAATVSALLLAACALGSIELHRAAGVEQALDAVRWEQIQEHRTDAPLRLWQDLVGEAVHRRWDDADAHRTLAELWMQRYRLATYERLLRQQIDATAEELWDRASLEQLYQAVRDLERAGDFSAAERLRQHPDVLAFLSPAWYHTRCARDACPWYPHTHYILAELSSVVGDERDDALHLSRARSLAPGDATLLYSCGILELSSGRIDQACDSWRQSLLLSTLHEADIIQRARAELELAVVIQSVLPQSPAAMLRIATQYWGGEPAAQDLIAEAMLRLLDRTATDPESRYLRGTALSIMGRVDEALVELQSAIAGRPTEFEWRFEYARLLHQQGELDEALGQARQCALAKPESRKYRALLVEITSARLRQPSAE